MQYMGYTFKKITCHSRWSPVGPGAPCLTWYPTHQAFQVWHKERPKAILKNIFLFLLMLEILNQHVPCSNCPLSEHPPLKLLNSQTFKHSGRDSCRTHRRCFLCAIHVDEVGGSEHLPLEAPTPHFSIILPSPSIPPLVQGPWGSVLRSLLSPCWGHRGSMCDTHPPSLRRTCNKKEKSGEKMLGQKLRTQMVGCPDLCQVLEEYLGTEGPFGLCPFQNISYVTA